MSSARQGWEGTVKIPVEERESPNHQVPYVSAHIRVYWPGNATDEQVLAALQEAYEVSAYAALARKNGLPEPYVWTEEEVAAINQRASEMKAQLDDLTE